MPRDLSKQLTCWMPLTHTLVAHGAGNTTPTYTRATVATGTLPSGAAHIAAAGIPVFEAGGLLAEPARTNLLTYSDDFTQAAWVAVNMTATYDQVGPNGVAGTASRLTATDANATILQTLVSGSAARTTSTWVKRITGTGEIAMTHAAVPSYTAITVTSEWTRVIFATATITNPVVGFRIATSGDVIDVALIQNEVGSFATSAIQTAAAAVTRNLSVLTYPVTGNIAETGAMAMTLDTYAIAYGTMVPFDSRAAGATNGLCYFAPDATGALTSRFHGGANTDIAAAAALVNNIPTKIAYGWQRHGANAGVQQYVVGGVSKGVGAGIAPSAHTTLTIGCDANTSVSTAGHIRGLCLFGAKLTKADLERAGR